MKDLLLIKGEALATLSKLISQGIVVDAIITDPPYGTTACKWDSVIPFNKHVMMKRTKRSNKMIPFYEDEYIFHKLDNDDRNLSYQYYRDEFREISQDGMWDKLNQIIKPNGAIVLFGSEPFSSALRMSNIKNYKYDWIWNKNSAGNVLVAKFQPLKNHELIHVFSSKEKASYYPQYSFGHKDRTDEKPVSQKSDLNQKIKSGVFKQSKTNKPKDARYPKSILEFSKQASECANGKAIHPTQKPISLMEYLIKTYTNEGEVVLDFTMGSASTAIACLNTKRKFIGIEMDDNYFKIASERVENHLRTLDYEPTVMYINQ